MLRCDRCGWLNGRAQLRGRLGRWATVGTDRVGVTSQPALELQLRIECENGAGAAVVSLNSIAKTAAKSAYDRIIGCLDTCNGSEDDRIEISPEIALRMNLRRHPSTGKAGA